VPKEESKLIQGREVDMLSSNEALQEKIHSFMRRKETQYPELAKPTKHEASYAGGLHEAIDPQPYILS
jgi:hypothetical protein